MNTEALTYQKVWDRLSAIDCGPYTKEIDVGIKLTYLSWAWAWAIMMQYYPDAQLIWLEDEDGSPTGIRYHKDGTATVHCMIRIPDGQGGWLNRECWLPVMDNKNRAIKNPDARRISDSKMRCMVKCLAFFGLGHYLYAGEDLPIAERIGDPEREEAVEALNAAGRRAASRGVVLPPDIMARAKDVRDSTDVSAIAEVTEDILALVDAELAQRAVEEEDQDAGGAK